MGKKETLEIKRQLFHIFLGIFLMTLVYFDLIREIYLLLLIVVGFFLSEVSRTKKLPVLYWFLKEFGRPENMKTFPGKGLIFFLLGTLLVLIFFQKDVALAALAILTFGDSFTALTGTFLNKSSISYSWKTLLIGSVTGTMAAFFPAMLFVTAKEAFFASFIAIVIAAVELKINKATVDDNIIIPVIAGAVIAAIRLI